MYPGTIDGAFNDIQTYFSIVLRLLRFSHRFCIFICEVVISRFYLLIKEYKLYHWEKSFVLFQMFFDKICIFTVCL